jgi:hypothetical protein
VDGFALNQRRQWPAASLVIALSGCYSGKGQHAKIGYMATAVVLSFCTLIAEIFFMVKLLQVI